MSWLSPLKSPVMAGSRSALIVRFGRSSSLAGSPSYDGYLQSGVDARTHSD